MSDEKALTRVEEAKKALAAYTPDEMGTILDYMLAKSFPPEKIQGLIQELCEATDEKIIGGQLREVKNWAAKDKGLEKLLKLHPATREKMKNLEGNREAPPAKITFITVNNVNVQKDPPNEVLDVTEPA